MYDGNNPPSQQTFSYIAVGKKLQRDGKIFLSSRKFEDPYKGAGVSHGVFYEKTKINNNY